MLVLLSIIVLDYMSEFYYSKMVKNLIAGECEDVFAERI